MLWDAHVKSVEHTGLVSFRHWSEVFVCCFSVQSASCSAQVEEGR